MAQQCPWVQRGARAAAAPAQPGAGRPDSRAAAARDLAGGARGGRPGAGARRRGRRRRRRRDRRCLRRRRWWAPSCLLLGCELRRDARKCDCSSCCYRKHKSLNANGTFPVTRPDMYFWKSTCLMRRACSLQTEPVPRQSRGTSWSRCAARVGPPRRRSAGRPCGAGGRRPAGAHRLPTGAAGERPRPCTAAHRASRARAGRRQGPRASRCARAPCYRLLGAGCAARCVTLHS